MVRTIRWSGYDWTVKTGSGLGPGPNNWSDSSSDVYVDIQDRLHLRIAFAGSKWYCTEVVSVNNFGYGTYEFNVMPLLQTLDPNAVLGLFTYASDDKEIDVEYSQWGNPGDTKNAGFTVQPPLGGGYIEGYNTHRFNIPLDKPSTTSFSWMPSHASFLTTSPAKSETFNSTANIPQSPTVPPTKVILNLWLYRGMPPQSGQEQEYIISSFRFSQPSKYSCISNTCIEDLNGQYTDLLSCKAVCNTSPPPPPPQTGCKSNEYNVFGQCVSKDIVIISGTVLVMMAALRG